MLSTSLNYLANSFEKLFHSTYHPTEQENALDFFKKMYQLPPSDNLQAYFDSFKERSANPDFQTILDGIQQFTKIVNANGEERTKFYGNKFQGLQFTNNLASLWNANFPKNPTERTPFFLVCPPSWRVLNEKGATKILEYNSDKPLSIGLNELIQGPTSIDCGMFCQLSIWMGSRAYLGDKLFDELFQYTPFRITPYLYEPISNNDKFSYSQNPLYPFFNPANNSIIANNALEIIYVQNDLNYLLKHPGGVSRGENCLVINGEYTLFANQPETQACTLESVETYLRDAYNAPQDEHDDQVLNSYASHTKQVRETFGISFGEYFKRHRKYASHQLTLDDWEKGRQEREQYQTRGPTRIVFDYIKFTQWIERIQKARAINRTNYIPNDIHVLNNLPETILNPLPPINKTISFSNIKTETSLQQELKMIGFQFCESIQQRNPRLVTLHNSTASKSMEYDQRAIMTACYKELASQGKKVLWLSEMPLHDEQGMIKFFNLQKLETTMFEQLNNQMHNSENNTVDNNTSFIAWRDQMKTYRKTLQNLLTQELEVLFIDNSVLANCAGHILVEEAYRWYATHLNKGLFINGLFAHSIRDLYGNRLLNRDELNCSPWIDYDHIAYCNMTLRLNMDKFYLQSQRNENNESRSPMSCILQ